MNANLLKVVDFLRDELQEFYRVKHSDGTEGAEAAARLRVALQRVESVVNPASEQGDSPPEQRWGYLLLVSFVQTAHHELQQHDL
jgi:hypothetical protein